MSSETQAEREARARAVVSSLRKGDRVRVCAEPREMDGAASTGSEAGHVGEVGTVTASGRV